MDIRQALLDLRVQAEDPSVDSYCGRGVWDEGKVHQSWSACQSSLSAIQDRINDIIWELDSLSSIEIPDEEMIDIELDDNPLEDAGRHERVQRWLEYRDLYRDTFAYGKHTMRSLHEYVVRQDIRDWLDERDISYQIYKSRVDDGHDAHFISIPVRYAVEFRLRWFG